MARHRDWDHLQSLLPAVRGYQALATKHGINDIFQDNGGKILQMLMALNLQGLPGREGNDAVDENKNEYELKSANLSLTASFSTHHHMNPTIIKKYRSVDWYFAAFQDIEMRRIFLVRKGKLAPIFDNWEEKLKLSGSKGHLNNPKIKIEFVIENGEEVFSDESAFSLEDAKRVRRERKKKADSLKANAAEMAGTPPKPKKARGKRSLD